MKKYDIENYNKSRKTGVGAVAELSKALHLGEELNKKLYKIPRPGKSLINVLLLYISGRTTTNTRGEQCLSGS